MKLANVGGRATVVIDRGAGIDVASASNGRFGDDVQALYEQWSAFRTFAAHLDPGRAAPFDERLLCSPAPRPRQVFAIGLNYREHAIETGMEIPSVPVVFTKFPASLAGPFDDIELVASTVDWEAELVIVIGERCDRVPAIDAWSCVAGLTVGQDISERTLQMAAGRQFSLGKSYRGYGPMGPWLVTPDEFADPDNLALGCLIDGVQMQSSRTADLIFDVPTLIACLSNVLPLLAGDVIFTGTPSGVGMSRTPPRFLRTGELLETWVEGVGVIRNRITTGVER